MLGECWWDDPLASDVHNALRQKEKHLMPYHSYSPQVHTRRFLVDWLAVICDKIEVCLNARHLAVHLLDFFMDNFDIGGDRLQLVAFGSLLVASKFEELECQVPRWKTLNKFLESPGYTSIEYMQMELMILKFYQWNVAFPTAADFAPYYMVTSMLDNMKDDLNSDYRRKVFSQLQQYLDYFLEISLQDHVYRFFHPSLVAAGCVAASRISVRLVPTWPLCIEKLTLYTWDQVSSVVDFLLKALSADEECARKKDCASPNSDSNCDSSPASSCSNHSLGSDGLTDVYERCAV